MHQSSPERGQQKNGHTIIYGSLGCRLFDPIWHIRWYQIGLIVIIDISLLRLTLRSVGTFPKLLLPCMSPKKSAQWLLPCQVFALRQLCQSSMTSVRADAWHLRKLFTYACKKSGFGKDRKSGKSPSRKVLCFTKFCKVVQSFFSPVSCCPGLDQVHLKFLLTKKNQGRLTSVKVFSTLPSRCPSLESSMMSC